MKYMVLIDGDGRIDSMGHNEAGAVPPTSTAKSVGVREGRRLVTDGPFAETREQLGAMS